MIVPLPITQHIRFVPYVLTQIAFGNFIYPQTVIRNAVLE